ncbi:homeobox domain protein [Ceratobasidium sp. AG-Ba]|nr:homeobox domain protein [Ceratobasidium sp. AG-Ba]
MTDVPPGASDKRRTKLTWAQLVRLEGIFAQTWYPSWADKDALAREFALEHQQVNDPLLDFTPITHLFCRSMSGRPQKHPRQTHPQPPRPPDPRARPDARARLPALVPRLVHRARPPGPRPPPIRTDDDARRPPPAPVSAESAASIQAQLSSSLSAALLGSSSAAYRTPYRPDDRDRDRDRSPSPAHPHPRATGATAQAPATRHMQRANTPTRSPTGPARALAPHPSPRLHPSAVQTMRKLSPRSTPRPAFHPPSQPRQTPSRTTRTRLATPQVASPTVLSPSDDPRKALLAQPIQAPPHVGALQSAPHVGAFHSMPVVGVFQGTAPPPTELPISVWQAHPLVRTRARITREQLRALEALFAKTWFPTSQQRAEAASVTGMREYSVTVWFQNRRSKAKKEGLQPPEGDRSKLRKDKGPKRDLGTHVFEVGSSRHPEPMAAPATGTPYASAPAAPGTPAQNLVWLEDARSRGLAPVMKTNGSQSGYAENAADRPGSPRSWTDAEGELESDAEMESEADSRPRGSSQPQIPAPR